MGSRPQIAAGAPGGPVAYERFLARYPGYLETAALDGLRATGYRRLDENRQVYLDHTGGSLYAESQVQQHLDVLRGGIFGNPHSANPASAAITDLVESTRRATGSRLGSHFMCAEHVRQLEGESPFDNLMEVKS